MVTCTPSIRHFMAVSSLVLLLRTGLATAQVSVTGPAVSVQSVSPSSAQVASAVSSITVTGANFTTASVVRWNSTTLTTHYQSATTLTADVTPALTATANTYPISVRDTSQGATLTSNSVPFTVWFADVPPAHAFYKQVNAIRYRGITAGCNPTSYCPTATLTRAQMAVFLLVANHPAGWAPPACSPPGIFSDVPCPGGFAVDWIEELYREGITAGCNVNPLRYCPNDLTQRQQMAVFLATARYGSTYVPPACSGIFQDVACPGGFTNWIEDSYNRSVVPACQTNPLKYCPGASVTRADMALDMSYNWALSLRGIAYAEANEPNFHLAGTYLGSVAKVSDVFSMFATAGFERYAYNQQTGQWQDIGVSCPQNPTQITDARCGDAHFLLWKHITCVQPPPDPGFIPCATNERYNVYNGKNNHLTYLDTNPANWPPAGIQRTISAYQLSAQHPPAPPLLPSVPSGNEGACRPQNPGSYPDGFSAPHVVYVPAPVDRYLMAFNGNIHATQPPFSIVNDNWRVLWSYSTDGAVWTNSKYLFRNSRESTDCESGFEVQDIDYYNGYLYLLLGAIDQLCSSQFCSSKSNRYYLLRANTVASPPYYGQWQLASGVTAAGDFLWTNVTPWSQTTPGTIDAQTIGYALFNGEQAYNASAAFARVPASPQGPYRWIFVTRRQNDGDIELWSTPSISAAPTFAAVIANTAGFGPSQYGWYFAIAKAGKNLPANDSDMANPIVLWLNAWTKRGVTNLKLDYRKLRLYLTGLPPYPP